MNDPLSPLPWKVIVEKLALPIPSKRRFHRKNGDFYILCPHHREKTPSMRFWNRSGRYRCFGCNLEGDKYEFVTFFLGVDTTLPDDKILEWYPIMGELLNLALQKHHLRDPNQNVFPFYSADEKV